MDWVDQALLVIHVGGISGDGVAADRLAKLRNLGLRTATDLVTAAADVPARTGTVRDRSALNAVFGTEAELVMVVDSITTEPNFAFVSWWKTSPLGHPAGDRKLVIGADGCLRERPLMDGPGACGSIDLNGDRVAATIIPTTSVPKRRLPARRPAA